MEGKTSMNFCHLHGHDCYSFMDGYGLPHQVAERIAALGHTACATTNHGNIFSHAPFEKAMKARGIKPIFGSEFYICDNVAKMTRVDETLGVNSYSHVTVLALTQPGYQNLLKLSRRSYDHFYYRPRIDWQLLARHQEGLAVLSGCPMGYPTRLLEAQGLGACCEFMLARKQEIEHWYMEIDPSPGFDLSEKHTGQLAVIARQLKIPMVLTADAHFPEPKHFQAQDVMCAVSQGKKVDDPERKIKLCPYYYYCTAEELKERAIQCAPAYGASIWDEALQNTALIADKAAVELPRAGKMLYVGLELGKTAQQTLGQWIADGLQRRLEEGKIELPVWHLYANRAKREFDTLSEKGFCDYMLVVIDAINEMKRRGSLVVTRGSAGGCLILWLCGASVTDPILHDLSFERFYDASRPDPPDVDVDFEQGRREEAIAYVREKYGETNTAHIAALAQLKAKSAVQDVAFAYGIPRHEVGVLTGALTSTDDDVDKQLHEVSDPKALAVLEKYPVLGELVPQLVGQYRQPSIHAAGLLVSSTPLDEAVGIVLGKDKQVVAAVDKRGAASLGFTKMDFLAVRSLDIVAGASRRLRQPMTWLEALPLDDPAALKVASDGLLAGVFQLDGASAARVLREIGCDHFRDVVAASALCRPGPGDWVSVYARHKRDAQSFADYLARHSECAGEVVKETYGILLYQEQVMRLAREMAGLPMERVQKLRKGVSDKLAVQADKEKAKAWTTEWATAFVVGAVQNGTPMEEAVRWWAAIQSHGGYSFNKSHCVTYACVGYWMCYLKAHHPEAFYESYLSLETDPIVLKRLIREFVSMGGQVSLLSPERTQMRFSSDGAGTVCGGLLNLRGIGLKTAEKLAQKAPFQTWDKLLSALPKAVRERVQKTGLPEGKWDDVQQLVLLAPWFPVPALGATEAAIRWHSGLGKLSELPQGLPVSGDVAVCGYVVATAMTKEKVIFAIEDETGTVICRVKNKEVGKIGHEFRGLKVADFIVARGWWSGDALYLKSAAVALPCPDTKEEKDGEGDGAVTKAA
jgi:DNA polymerase-3 subunit alpha